MKALFLILLLSFCCVSKIFPQPTRADIIAHRIKSITTISWEGDSTQKAEIKNYYSRKGDDSIEYYNGVVSFKFVPEFDSQKRVSKLVRFDSKEREDELHIYNYNKDGSYSIEKISQGAGTISQAKYDRKNRCLEEIIEVTDKIKYEFNSSGKPVRVFYKYGKGKMTLSAIISYDSKGLPTKIETKGENPTITIIKNNERGLISEMRNVDKDESGKPIIKFASFQYEFYDE